MSCVHCTYRYYIYLCVYSCIDIYGIFCLLYTYIHMYIYLHSTQDCKPSLMESPFVLTHFVITKQRAANPWKPWSFPSVLLYKMHALRRMPWGIILILNIGIIRKKKHGFWALHTCKTNMFFNEGVIIDVDGNMTSLSSYHPKSCASSEENYEKYCDLLRAKFPWS